MASETWRRWLAGGLVGLWLGAGAVAAADVPPSLPHASPVSLDEALQGAAREGRLQGVLGEKRVPAQFVAETPGGAQGVCLFLAPGELPAGVTFVAAADAAPPALAVTRDAAGQVLVTEGGQPVLRYNFQPVPVPEGVTGPYAVARSDYIHPLFGPAGEELTRV